jgi:hypothetical protein
MGDARRKLLMQLPRFTLLYTTIRPAFVSTVVEKWMTRAVRPDMVTWAITTDADKADTFKAIAEATRLHKIEAEIDLVRDLPGTCVKGWNLAAEAAKRRGLGDIIIAVADDFDPPEQWDDQLASVAEGEWWHEDKVVHVADGYNPDIFTLAILTKKRLERFGYLFYPGYESMFCDTEFTFVAHHEHAVIQATHLLFEHLHPDCGKRQRDDADLNHSSSQRYKVGDMLFKYRQANGFPIDAGPSFDATRVEAKDLAVYIQATKDDFCLFEVCERLYEEGIKAFFFYIPNEYWSGRAVPREDSDQVIEIANRLQTTFSDVEVHYRIFDIKPHRAPGRSRIQVETFARNEALEWVRGYDFKHIVVADGDELWRRGLLTEMLDVINDFKPICVYTGMVPIVGLPGYPIEGAMDKASIYVNHEAKFQECRGTFGAKYELKGHKIFHFTATRRTMDEIIKKNRDSGHYDDPNYDFEGWIANVLPNIKPGMRNAHMYRPYNPWKLVREWALEEKSEIPPSLYRYLAIQ